MHFIADRLELETPLHLGLRARLDSAREQTDSLFALVDEATLRARAAPELQRLIFYLGHLEAFDSNLLLRDCLGRDSRRPDMDRLFAFGIGPPGAGLPTDDAADWPHVVDVRRYRDRQRTAIDAALASTSLLRPVHPDLQNGWAVKLAIEHRLMHAETLAYLIHRLPHTSKRGASLLSVAAVTPSPTRLVEIPTGMACLGLSRSFTPFHGWDHEYEAHDVSVAGFAIESNDVTNADFLGFVSEGGYDDASLWTKAGWAWNQTTGREHPALWAQTRGKWAYRGMFAEAPLGLSRPVYVSHSEAAAYARWRGRTLPTEAQFHRAAYGTPEGRERLYPWGEAQPLPRRGVFDSRLWDPAPVGSHPDGNSAWGVADLVGNGWEWTATPLAPFPGFEPQPSCCGCSAALFDGDHYVMKGGSPRTDASLLRRSFRNGFQLHDSHAYTTFRCVGARA